jgi:hypothetical protein
MQALLALTFTEIVGFDKSACPVQAAGKHSPNGSLNRFAAIECLCNWNGIIKAKNDDCSLFSLFSFFLFTAEV